MPAKRHATSLTVQPDQPLIAIVLEEDGQEVVRYFADEDAADAALPRQHRPRALSVIGAWSDLDWEDMDRELDKIRHESQPTPPIENL